MRGMVLVTIAALSLAGCQNLVAPTPGEATDPQSAPVRCSMEFDGSRFTRPTAIGNDPAGVPIGPLAISDDGRTIQDVVLELEISHPYTGDVSAWLYYDADDDGTYDAETPIEFYLARLAFCLVPPRWSYPVDLDGRYFFRHEAEAEDLDGWDVGEFASFRGLNKGGSFYLRVVDAGSWETGMVESWAVHVK